MIEHWQALDTIDTLLESNPVVLKIGARQVGETTLAQQFSAQTGAALIYYDWNWKLKRKSVA